MEINREKGQTLVEYILLLAVVISLVVTFYNSQFFKQLFGTQGSVGLAMKEEAEFSYRHAFSRNRPTGALPARYYGPQHPSYYDAIHNETRFFGAKEIYR